MKLAGAGTAPSGAVPFRAKAGTTATQASLAARMTNAQLPDMLTIKLNYRLDSLDGEGPCSDTYFSRP